MLWGILTVIVLTLAALVLKISKSLTPAGFSRELAKAQKYLYQSLRTAHPDWSREKLYGEGIARRPTYTAQTADIILDAVRAKSRDGKINLRKVLLELAVYEYQRQTGEDAEQHRPVFQEGIKQIIPEEI